MLAPGKIPYKDNLESARLITRFVTMDDAHAWLAYCSDPVATTYTAVPGMTAEEMATYVMQITLQRYSDGRLGLQALIDKQTGELVGKCGLLLQDVAGVTEMEIGYHLVRKNWGRGYATEAAQLFRDYCFENDFAQSVISIIHPQNEASKNVARRNGMTLESDAVEFRGGNYNIFRITKAEWQKRRKTL